MKFLMQVCLGICIFEVLMTWGLRFQLVNDRNDRTGKSLFHCFFVQKVKNESQKLKFHKDSTKSIEVEFKLTGDQGSQ